MNQSIVHISLFVNDYDEAIDFYVKKLGFELIEDSYKADQNRRWVLISPPGSVGCTVLLQKGSQPLDRGFVDDSVDNRIRLFLNTDDFWRDYQYMKGIGVKFLRMPEEESYGVVASFEDLYANVWDLLQLNESHPVACHAAPVKEREPVLREMSALN